MTRSDNSASSSSVESTSTTLDEKIHSKVIQARILVESVPTTIHPNHVEAVLKEQRDLLDLCYLNALLRMKTEEEKKFDCDEFKSIVLELLRLRIIKYKDLTGYLSYTPDTFPVERIQHQEGHDDFDKWMSDFKPRHQAFIQMSLSSTPEPYRAAIVSKKDIISDLLGLLAKLIQHYRGAHHLYLKKWVKDRLQKELDNLSAILNSIPSTEH